MMRVGFGIFWALLLAIIGMTLTAALARVVFPASTSTHDERGAFGLVGLGLGIGCFIWLQQRDNLPGWRRRTPDNPLGAGRILYGAAWLLGLSIVSITMGDWLARKLLPVAIEPARALVTVSDLTIAVVGFLWGVNGNFLPGLRHQRPDAIAREVKWGIAQAAWLVIGFFAMQLAGAFVCAFSISIVTHLNALIRHGPQTAMGGGGTIAAAVDGYLACALWSVWYIRRLGPTRVQDGSPTGIGWRPAVGSAYLTAGLFAVLIIAVVMLLFHLVPPNQANLNDTPMGRIFGRPGWPLLILVLLATLVAPPVEEWVFRGGIFAALSARLSPLWAGLITTGLFVAMHAPEKIHYPLGFIDVAMLGGGAAWLRVRYGSIRPGILLHVLYNGGGVLAAALLPHLA